LTLLAGPRGAGSRVRGPAGRDCPAGCRALVKRSLILYSVGGSAMRTIYTECPWCGRKIRGQSVQRHVERSAACAAKRAAWMASPEGRAYCARLEVWNRTH